MSDFWGAGINGIPNYGFEGTGGPIGGVPNVTPAWSSDQINRSMWGNLTPGSGQAALQNNFNNFGQQTDYYSALGAAYGRAVGPSMPVGTYPTSGGPSQDMINALSQQSGEYANDGMDGGTPYTPFGDGVYDPNHYGPATGFSGRWGETVGQPAIDAVNNMGQYGIQPWQQNYSVPPANPEVSQFTSGTPWWTQGTDPNLLAAHDALRAGRGWTIGQQVGQDPSLAQNINQSMYDVGNASAPYQNMFNRDAWMAPVNNGTLGYMDGTGGYYSEFAPPNGQDASRIDTSQLWGADPNAGVQFPVGYGGFDNWWGANQFANRFEAGGPAFSNMDPSQYYAGDGFRSQNTGVLQGPAQMPPNFTPNYSMQNQNGMVTRPTINGPMFVPGG